MAFHLKKIVNALRHMAQPKGSIEEIAFLDRKFKLVRGTWRLKVDKDDAWYVFLVRKSSVILDIGANVGYTAMLANIYGSPRKIVLVDPNPDALSTAAYNMILNSFSLNCVFCNGFMGDKPGDQVKFFTIGRGAAGSMYASHAKTAAVVNNYYFVNTISVDVLCNQLSTIPELIKIDVEGAEMLVLSGAVEIARKRKSRFFIEMHSNEELSMMANAAQVIAWCTKVDYKPFYLKDHAELTSPQMIAHRGKCHLLLIPSEERYPEELNRIQEGDELPLS